MGDRSTEGAETTPATGTASKKHQSITKANPTWDPEGNVPTLGQLSISIEHNSLQPDRQTQDHLHNRHQDKNMTRSTSRTTFLPAIRGSEPFPGGPRGGGRAHPPYTDKQTNIHTHTHTQHTHTHTRNCWASACHLEELASM